jgi:hypothetical protein
LPEIRSTSAISLADLADAYQFQLGLSD